MSEYIIYKLVHATNLDLDYCYVGSTKAWYKRKSMHKSNSTNVIMNRLKVYQVMNENGGFNAWLMIKLETIVCDSKRDAHVRERWWYEKLNAKLNMVRPSITIDELKEYQVEYRKINKDNIYAQQNVKHQCDCGGRFTHQNKLQHLHTKKHINFINNLIETPN